MSSPQLKVLLVTLVALVSSYAWAEGGAGYVRPERDELRRVFGLRWQQQLVPADRNVEGLDFPPRQLQTPFISLDNGIVYAGTEAGDLFAYWLSSGKEVWKRRAFGGIGRGMGQHKDHLILGVDSSLVALEGHTGREVWRLDVGGETGGEITVSGTIAFAPIRPTSFVAIDAVEGKLLWRAKRPKVEGITVRGAARPTVDRKRGRVYLGFPDGALVAVDLKTGRTLWAANLGKRNAVFSDVDGEPQLLHDGKVVFATSYNGGAYALNADTGRAEWKNEDLVRLIGVTRIEGTDMLCAAHGDGRLMGLDNTTGRVRWVYRFEKGAPTVPRDVGRGFCAAGSSDGPLAIVDANNGKPTQLINPGTGLLSAPAIRRDDMVILTTKGRLIAMRFGKGQGNHR